MQRLVVCMSDKTNSARQTKSNGSEVANIKVDCYRRRNPLQLKDDFSFVEPGSRAGC